MNQKPKKKIVVRTARNSRKGIGGGWAYAAAASRLIGASYSKTSGRIKRRAVKSEPLKASPIEGDIDPAAFVQELLETDKIIMDYLAL
ncbi:hypothetical protein [Rhizobium sp. FKY42]|uniref:hypothetical protein n=1 Tax=Rhizobium sp. FKY42 TaxID=2562310 RepID=UPI0010BFDE16|nr:hypothetical protein [Rhizobium sp. FKY42]